MAENTLVVPFLTDDPLFARGVEFGMLYAEMKNTDRVEDYFTLDNQEQILLLANRLDWHVVEMKQYDNHWFTLVMEKR